MPSSAPKRICYMSPIEAIYSTDRAVRHIKSFKHTYIHVRNMLQVLHVCIMCITLHNCLTLLLDKVLVPVLASTTVPFAPVTGTCFNPGFQFRLCRQGKIVTQHCASESSSKRKKNAQRGMK